MAVGLGQSKHDYLQHDQLVARALVGVHVHWRWPEGRFVQGQAGKSVQRHAGWTETRPGGGQAERPRETPSAGGQLGVRQAPKSRSSRRKQVSAIPLYYPHIYIYMFIVLWKTHIVFLQLNLLNLSRANRAIWNISWFRLTIIFLFRCIYNYIYNTCIYSLHNAMKI